MNLVEDNLNLAHWMANKYRSVEDPEDLYQAACVGLVKAAGVYDPSKGTFATLARWHMRREIQRYLRQAGRLHGRGAGKILPRMAQFPDGEVEDRRGRHQVVYRPGNANEHPEIYYQGTSE